MTTSTYPQGLQLVLAHEGGYVNHPKDPGGPTNKGVTQAVYDAYRRAHSLPIRTVRNITAGELGDIYFQQFWRVAGCDQLPAGLDYAVFDFAVNSGPGRALKMLQKVLGIGQDGDWGNETYDAACSAMNTDEVGLIERYCAARLSWLKTLKTYKTFGKGWRRRVAGDFDGTQESDHGVVDYAVQIAAKDLAYPVPRTALPSAIGSKPGEENGKAPEASQAVSKTREGKGLITAAAGTIGTGIATATTIANQAQQASNVATTGVNAAVTAKKAVVAAQPLIDTNVLLFVLLVFLLVALAGMGYLFYSVSQRLKEKVSANDRHGPLPQPA